MTSVADLWQVSSHPKIELPEDIHAPLSSSRSWTLGDCTEIRDAIMAARPAVFLTA